MVDLKLLFVRHEARYVYPKIMGCSFAGMLKNIFVTSVICYNKKLMPIITGKCGKITHCPM